MAKKKDAFTGSADAPVLRRSGRETSLRKQTTSSPVNSSKSERLQKHASPCPSPVKNKLEKIEKQMWSSPLRRFGRGKKLVVALGLPSIKRSGRGKRKLKRIQNRVVIGLPCIKSTKEKTANNSKQSLEDVNEVKKTEKQDPDVGRKRKKYDAYKTLFKPQRIQYESDVDKVIKNQNSIRIQGAPDKDHNASLEGRVIDLDPIEHDGCPQTKSLDGKSIENGEVEKKNSGDVSPSNGNIANSDNHMSHASSYRIEHDLENQQELDTCHKVTKTCKAVGSMETAENNDVSSNMQNSKFVEFWVPVQISNVQLEQYCATLLSNAMALCSSLKSDNLGTLKDIFITNRKCCNHPYTVDPKVEQSLTKDKDPSMVVDVGAEASGKLQFLDYILPEIQKRQLKVVILFQPTSGALSGSLSLGQILVDFVHRRFGQNSYEYVDGVPNISSKKQAAIKLNRFYTDMTKFIFLLESRACHQSIKLSSVDAIIVFESELNPLNDLKSLRKLSIDSQSEQIMIFRLYSLSTLEEKILKLAENNVALDTRSHSLRSNYDALLTWGASDLFEKLTKFHSQTVLNISSEESFLKDVVGEFLDILSHKCKSNDTTLKSIITRVQNCGIYGKNTSLHSEIKTHVPNGDQPYIFWRKLLEGRFPVWKFVSESTPRQRKRPNYCVDSPPHRQSGVDGGCVKTRKMTVYFSTIEPAQLRTVTERETGGVNEGVSAANDKSQSSSGNRFSSTTVNNETSLLDFLKPAVSELCNILKFSEDVKIVVGAFLEFVLDNYKVSKEHTSILQAFMISVCWIGSSLAKNIIDRSESFALAKKHFDFSCEEEQAESVYKKLKQIKETFLERTQVRFAVKDRAPALEGVKLGIKTSQHITNVDTSSENVSRNGVEEFEKNNREWDERRVTLENDAPTLPENPIEAQSHDEHVCEGANDIECTGSHTSEKEMVDATVSSEQIGKLPAQQFDDMEVDVTEKVYSSHENSNRGTSSPDVSHAVEDHNETGANDVVSHVHSGDVEMQAGKYNKENDEDSTLERKFANKFKEHETFRETCLGELKATMPAAVVQVAAENEFSLHGSQHETQVLHSGNPEVAPTLPETPIETESHDEPVCEGANHIKSTGSHTSEKEMVDATVSSEQIGEVPAQQLDDMAEKVDSSHETSKGGTSSPDASHAVEKPKRLEREFANKLHEHEILWETSLDELEVTMLAAEGPMAAENEFSMHESHHEARVVHSGNPEVPPTLPENLIAQSHDEPVCEGANDIESTDSYTSVKEMVDATVLREQIGEVPAQQLDGDMEVDVAEKVDSSHETSKGGTSSPYTSHAVEDLVEKLKRLEREYANNLEKHKISWETSLEKLEVTMLRAEGPKAAENEFSMRGSHHEARVVHSGNPEVTLTLPENQIEAQCHDEPVCEGANGTESTGSHTSEKEMVDAAVSSKQIGVPAQLHGDDMEVDVAEKVDSGHENAKGGTSSPYTSRAVEDPVEKLKRLEREFANKLEEHEKLWEKCLDELKVTMLAAVGQVAAENEFSLHGSQAEVDSADMGTPDGTCDEESIEDGEIYLDTPDVSDDHNQTSRNDVLPRVESVEMATPAVSEENAEDSVIRLDALHANKDHNDSFGSDSGNPVCAAISQDKTPSVQLVSSPASDLEIQNEPLQLEPFPESGVQGVNVGNLQPSAASQLDQIIPDDEPESPSSTGETPHEEQQPRLATSVAPAPPVNALKMFDSLTNQVSPQMPNQSDPLEAEVEWLYTEKDNATKFHQETKQRLNTECENEIAEIVAQISLKYEAKHLEADAEYNSQKMELETNINKVIMSRVLAEAFRCYQSHLL